MSGHACPIADCRTCTAVAPPRGVRPDRVSAGRKSSLRDSVLDVALWLRYDPSGCWWSEPDDVVVLWAFCLLGLRAQVEAGTRGPG